MNARRLLLLLLVVVLASAPLGESARAQSQEERYVDAITTWLIEADGHLLEASNALTDCLGNFSGCVKDRSLVVARLNASRNGLVAVRAGVASLAVPERYRTVNDLAIRGLTGTVDGTALHMEGLNDGSLGKFQAGSALMSQGREDLRETAGLLTAMPPRSVFDEVLVYLVAAITASVAASVAFFVWWYRRGTRARTPPPPDQKGT